jgi:hypothetical protein
LPNLGALLAIAGAACAGPSFHLDAPAAAQTFVDGRRSAPTIRPVPYYGTCVVDALPRLDGARARDFSHTHSRTIVEFREPVTPWLFPLDWPLELLGRVFSAPKVYAVRAELADNPTPLAVGYLPSDLQEIRDRALAARAER